MSPSKKALLLVGSPKGEESTSLSLGSYLLSKLEESGMTSETLFTHRVVNREEKVQSLFEAIDRADLIILTFPLYIDSLPAPVIKAMELIKEERDRLESKKPKDFIAISNNGFPEAFQNMTALHICKIFAEDCGFTWKGGLPLGQGGSIGGRPLLEIGGMVRNVVKGLDLVAQALIDGKVIPQEAIDLFSKRFIPNSLYSIMVNLSWRRQASKYGTKKIIREKTYANSLN
ncbi:MAG: NAD(P)H-dependent oxidoreductase [Candidatus Thorarchaeota archaeon]